MMGLCGGAAGFEPETDPARASRAFAKLRGGAADAAEAFSITAAIVVEHHLLGRA